MTREDLREILFDFLDRLAVDVDESVDVDGLTEDFLSELEDNGTLASFSEE